MPTIKTNTFTQYELTEQDWHQGSILTMEQRCCIQSLLATDAQQRLNLIPDPNNYPGFIQSEAYFKGRIQAFEELLSNDETARQKLSQQQPT